MAKTSINIKGTAGVINALKGFGREGKRVVEEETVETAFAVETLAKKLAPVDTGKLRQSIAAEKITRFSWTVTAHEIYAIWVEFGTVRQTAQPFLFPAWKSKGVILYRRNLRKALERLGKKYSSK